MLNSREIRALTTARTRMMPVCILGMHRSGTSMIARLLNLCGVYLGREDEMLVPIAEDNQEGYWENQLIQNLNDEMLRLLGGSWSKPPEMPSGWSQRPQFKLIAYRAKGIFAEYDAFSVWGWKDPRN